MKLLCCAMVLVAPFAGCGVGDDEEASLQDLNANSRYTVESVHVLGLRSVRISGSLRHEIDKVVGARFDDPALKRLADRIRKELRVSDVAIRVSRGAQPDHVIVNFEVTGSFEQNFDVNVAKLLYDSREGWSGEGDVTTYAGGNAFSIGLLSDGDSLAERYSGIRVKFERTNMGTDRLQFRFEFDSFNDQWNPATLAVARPSDIYSTRQVFTPEATLVIARPLELSFGVSFDRFRVPDGGAAAANTESSNAVVNTLRYHQRWGSEYDEQEQEVTGSYSIRASTGLLGADAIYTRHFAQARYRFRRAYNTVEVGFLAGRIVGQAPLFDRFFLGDSTTLRGWSMFDLDPLGGSRVIHGSVDYRYRYFEAFYDTGAIWDRGTDREPLQSTGVGFKKEPFQVAVALPIRSGPVEPIFFAGLCF